MRRMLLLAALLPSFAFGQGVRPAMVNTRMISPASSARYVYFASGSLTSTANGALVSVLAPVNGRLVDMLVYQQAAGTVGTSFTVDVKTVGGTSLLSTLPVLTVASGADKVTDAKGAVALPSGWTRPVVKVDGGEVVTKGQRLLISTVETGAYGTHATFFVALWYESSL